MSAADVVGVFDSGTGGLTVLRALIEAGAAGRYLYLGDTARLPYGTKSPATVRRYAERCGEFLVRRGVARVVVACNTVGAVALDGDVDGWPGLGERLGLPVTGVVEPGARAAIAAGGPIAVLGTEATVASGAYPRAIAALDPGVEVRTRACPLFVPLVEEGWTAGAVPQAVARRYLRDVGRFRTLLLACTHYPLLGATLAAVAPEATVVDSARATAAEVVAAAGGASGTDEPELQLYVSDSAERFLALSRRILGRWMTRVELVDL